MRSTSGEKYNLYKINKYFFLAPHACFFLMRSKKKARKKNLFFIYKYMKNIVFFFKNAQQEKLVPERGQELVPRGEQVPPGDLFFINI